jgi:DNA primase
MLKIEESAVVALIRKYGGRSIQTDIDATIQIKPHHLPSGTESMDERHRNYLIKRKFDPEKLEAEWGLLGTGPISLLDGINFKHRIIAPINWNGQQVSFQARDFTNRSDLRYITCPKVREIIHHKHILYGKQEEWGNVGICVEGITDVWRFGPKAFATFGIEYTRQQMILMANTFKKVWIAFDDDPQAVKQAKKLAGQLCFCGILAEVVSIIGDPGSMDQKEANQLVKDLIAGG